MKRHFSKISQIILLTIFCIGAIFIWLLPVLAVGFPFRLPYLEHAKQFFYDGIFPMDNQRLMPIIVSWFSSIIGWDTVLGWVLLSAIFMALALFVWWHSIRKIFDATVAWVATVLFAFFPLTWFQALDLNGYALMYAFLFVSILSYLYLHPDCAQHKKSWIPHAKKKHTYQSTPAITVSAIAFGIAIVCRDSIILFVPWCMVFYVWFHKKQWKKSSAEALLFFGIVGAIFSFPFIVQSLAPGLDAGERIEILLSARKLRKSSYGHFYRDQYTYEMERENYIQEKQKEFSESSWITKMQEENYQVMFGAQKKTFLGGLTNGIWLFVNQIPLLVKQTTMGGIFIWLFIIPGVCVVWRDRRMLCIALIGTYVSMELVLRFVFHFGRDHTMDVTYIFALFAAVGVVHISSILAKSHKKISHNIFVACITIVIALQCMQVTRVWFADLYRKSSASLAYAGKEVLNEVPSSAIVAHSNNMQDAFYFSSAKRIFFHDETMVELIKQQNLQSAFKQYGVTHVLGYTDDMRTQIQKQVPNIVLLPDIGSMGAKISITPAMGYILNLIR